MTFMASFVASLAFEAPFMALEKMIVGGRKWKHRPITKIQSITGFFASNRDLFFKKDIFVHIDIGTGLFIY